MLAIVEKENHSISSAALIQIIRNIIAYALSKYLNFCSIHQARKTDTPAKMALNFSRNNRTFFSLPCATLQVNTLFGWSVVGYH